MVNPDVLQANLAQFPALSKVLGANWVRKNFCDPQWQSLPHPLIVALWPPVRNEVLRALDEALTTLEEACISSGDIKDRLRDIGNYRSILPELFLAAHLLRSGFQVELPARKPGQRTPDICVRRLGEYLDLEVKALLPNISMGGLRMILHLLMTDQPYSIAMGIPDDIVFQADDIRRLCVRLARFMKNEPYECGRGKGRKRFCIGRTRHCIWLVSPHDGAHVTNVTHFSRSEETIRTAARRINSAMTQDAPEQLPNGGVVVLDISDTTPTLRAVAEGRHDDGKIRAKLWDGVPNNVFGVWMYHMRGGQLEPGYLRYASNPHCTSHIPTLIEDLRSGPLKDCDHGSRAGCEIEGVLTPESRP